MKFLPGITFCIFLLLLLHPDSSAQDIGTFGSDQLKAFGIYDYIAASSQGRSIGEMVLDIEGAPQRAYDVLKYAVFTSAYAISPRDDELTALRKVDSVLFEHMRFTRGLPGTTFTDALTKGNLDCSDASLIFLSASQRAGRNWRAAMAPFHMFVAAPEGSWFIFWETQTGESFDVYDMISFHGLRQELIENGVYLNRMSIKHHVAETYRNLGGQAVRAGKYSKAMGYLNKSLILWPDHPPTLIWRGYAYALTGKINEAAGDYSAALAIDPYDWVANLHLGKLYIQVGKGNEGRELIELAEKYRPQNTDWVLDEALPYIFNNQ